jgi:hypothetical protein
MACPVHPSGLQAVGCGPMTSLLVCGCVHYVVHNTSRIMERASTLRDTDDPCKT